jgi:hypothetical protein
LLDRAGLSIQTIESNAGSSIKKLDQASATVGTLGRALGNYGDELSRAMQEQVRVSAREASEQMLATLEPRFNKVFTRLWISLALFVVVMAATLIWLWPSQEQPRGPQSATAPRSRPPQP